MHETSKNIIRRLYGEALEKGQLALLDELFSENFRDYSTSEQEPGVSGVKEYFTQVRTGFPDIRVAIEDLIVEGETIAVRTVWRGTHLGRYYDSEPTGRQVERSMIQIFRLHNGKLAEEWNEGRGLLD